jgi:hypothetical protein
MTKRKTKRNAVRSQPRRDFKICNDPMVHLAEAGPPSDPGDRMGVTRVYGRPFIFGIARDAHTIFASWNIDWRSVFENAMPADRQVHLQAIGGDGVIETRVAVEPMSAMHYLTTSGFHQLYRVEIGYIFSHWTTGILSRLQMRSTCRGAEALNLLISIWRRFRFTSVFNSSLMRSERLTTLR